MRALSSVALLTLCGSQTGAGPASTGPASSRPGLVRAATCGPRCQLASDSTSFGSSPRLAARASSASIICRMTSERRTPRAAASASIAWFVRSVIRQTSAGWEPRLPNSAFNFGIVCNTITVGGRARGWSPFVIERYPSDRGGGQVCRCRGSATQNPQNPHNLAARAVGVLRVVRVLRPQL